MSEFLGIQFLTLHCEMTAAEFSFGHSRGTCERDTFTLVDHSSRYSSSSKCLQSKWLSDMIPATLVAETMTDEIEEQEEILEIQTSQNNCDSNLDQYLINTSSCSSITIENEQTILNFVEGLSSTMSESRVTKNFNYFLNMMDSSSSLLTSSTKIPISNSPPPTDEDVDRSSSMTSLSTISKTLFVSRLPTTISDRRLRIWFPGCRKVVFKKNQWNKNHK